MLATRIAGRVLLRIVSFGLRGALIMMAAGVIEGAIFGTVFNFMPRSPSMDGYQIGALAMLPTGFATGLIVFAAVGAWTSRRSDTHKLFTNVCRSAMAGSLAGAIIGAICFASLFAMLSWMTNGNFLPLPARAPVLAAGSIKATALVGYLLGVVIGFFTGTAVGAWRGAANAIKHESSTRKATI